MDSGIAVLYHSTRATLKLQKIFNRPNPLLTAGRWLSTLKRESTDLFIRLSASRENCPIADRAKRLFLMPLGGLLAILPYGSKPGSGRVNTNKCGAKSCKLDTFHGTCISDNHPPTIQLGA